MHPLVESILSKKHLSVLDSTKLVSYTRCPRRFFYAHVLGWRPELESVHLIYGQAYHYAQEELLLGLQRDGRYTPETVERAYERFLEHYRQFYSENDEEDNNPKNMQNTMLALRQYAAEYNGLDDFEVLYTEVSGNIPISEEYKLHFKIDAIVQDKRGILAIEHKTAGQASSSWADHWQMAFQPSVYIHALSSIWPLEEVYGLLINGTILRKQTRTGMGNSFTRVLVRKTKAMLQTVLWNLNEWYKLIQWDLEQLADLSPDDDTMTCFRMNPEDCTSYGSRCPYMDYCMAWQNPLQDAERPPLGLKVDPWNPLEQAERDAKARLENATITLRESNDADATSR